MEECVEQAVGEGVNALSLEGRGVSAEKGLCSPPSHTHTHCATLRYATLTSTHTEPETTRDPQMFELSS